jgi:Reverse transcriptase (RNA-dependent DNA polymerase)
MYILLQINQLLSTNQFGFRSNIGTEDAIMKLTSQIHSLIYNDEKPIKIFLDLAKTFDTVSHQLLFNKFNNICIWGLALDRIKSYVEGRNQSSNPKPIHKPKPSPAQPTAKPIDKPKNNPTAF